MPEFTIEFPKDLTELKQKCILLLWAIVLMLYWLMSLRFPKIYTYFLPFLVITDALISLFYFTSKINSLKDPSANMIIDLVS